MRYYRSELDHCFYMSYQSVKTIRNSLIITNKRRSGTLSLFLQIISGNDTSLENRDSSLYIRLDPSDHDMHLAFPRPYSRLTVVGLVQSV